MKKLMVCLLAMIFLAVWGTPVFCAEKTEADGKSLFEQKCRLCHSLKKPESKRMTEKEWEKTVMKMKNVNGAPITDEQAKAIIQYLSREYRKK